MKSEEGQPEKNGKRRRSEPRQPDFGFEIVAAAARRDRKPRSELQAGYTSLRRSGELAPASN